VIGEQTGAPGVPKVCICRSGEVGRGGGGGEAGISEVGVVFTSFIDFPQAKITSIGLSQSPLCCLF
jgi:hypothetical protein